MTFGKSRPLSRKCAAFRSELQAPCRGTSVWLGCQGVPTGAAHPSHVSPCEQLARGPYGPRTQQRDLPASQMLCQRTELS